MHKAADVMMIEEAVHTCKRWCLDVWRYTAPTSDEVGDKQPLVSCAEFDCDFDGILGRRLIL
jgi:hypothetical protein